MYIIPVIPKINDKSKIYREKDDNLNAIQDNNYE